MKGSNAISAKAKTGPRGGPPSASSPTRTADGFALTGKSDPPDPLTHAYRQDLADAALAGRVIASHYARPLARVVTAAAVLRQGPADSAEELATVSPGEPFDLLDCTLGWAWGYAGANRLVGYVREGALGA